MVAEQVCVRVFCGYDGNCLERIRQLEEANEALRTDVREAQELGEERYRHDRIRARQEAVESAGQVAQGHDSSKSENDALGA